MAVELLGVSDDGPRSSELRELAPDAEARVRASIARQTLLTTLGVTVEQLAPGYVELGLVNRADLTQQHGFAHAGALTTIADSACGYAAYTSFPEDRDVLTVDFSMSLVAPAARPAFVAAGRRDPLRADAHVLPWRGLWDCGGRGPGGGRAHPGDDDGRHADVSERLRSPPGGTASAHAHHHRA